MRRLCWSTTPVIDLRTASFSQDDIFRRAAPIRLEYEDRAGGPPFLRLTGEVPRRTRVEDDAGLRIRCPHLGLRPRLSAAAIRQALAFCRPLDRRE
jgi:hypothetical protein